MIYSLIHNDISFSRVPRKKIKFIIESILNDYKIFNAEIGIVLQDNKNIKKINSKFLNHNYSTDVISFRLEDEPLEGEIYISVEKALEQSKEYKVSLTNEMLRLVTHGMLHIIGFEDDTSEKREEMHKLENYYLSLKI